MHKKLGHMPYNTFQAELTKMLKAIIVHVLTSSHLTDFYLYLQ